MRTIEQNFEELTIYSFVVLLQGYYSELKLTKKRKLELKKTFQLTETK